MRAVTGRLNVLRAHNRVLILNQLRRGHTLSHTALSRDTGLSTPSVYRLVDELVDQGLVETAGVADATGGRPGTLLRLRPDGGSVLGVHLARPHMRMIVADLRAEVIGHAKALRGPDLSTDVQLMTAEASRLVAEHGLDRDRVLGMGIGVTGLFDTHRKVVSESPDVAGWSYVRLRDELATRLGMPVMVDSHVNVAAYGLHLLTHQDTHTMAHVLAGQRISAGLVLDGRLYRGHTNAVGQLGHFGIARGGKPCSCGGRGCVETLASVGAMVADHQRRAAASLEPRRSHRGFVELLEAEAAGDRRARSVLRRGGRALGVGLASLVNLLDPELVVLAGQATESETYRQGAIDQMHDRSVTPRERIRVELAADLGEHPVTLGAAAIVLQDPFRSPFFL